MVAVGPLRMSYAEYLAFEERADQKHEFVRGEIFAMAGGTIEHARLSTAVLGELRVALAGRRCVVYNADARVRIFEEDASTYPNASVVCGRLERARDDKEGVANPVVIVEVLSDSTEAYDRGEKFRRYRALPSLREYVLVSQHAPRIELFRRQDDGSWRFEEAGAGERLRLASLDISLDVDAIYRDPLAEPAESTA